MKREEQCEAVIPEKNGKPEYRCPRPVVREGVCGMHFNAKQRAVERSIDAAMTILNKDA